MSDRLDVFIEALLEQLDEEYDDTPSEGTEPAHAIVARVRRAIRGARNSVKASECAP